MTNIVNSPDVPANIMKCSGQGYKDIDIKLVQALLVEEEAVGGVQSQLEIFLGLVCQPVGVVNVKEMTVLLGSGYLQVFISSDVDKRLWMYCSSAP